MITGPNVIMGLKAAVAAVTILLLLSLVVLWKGNHRLHGRINLAFFILTLGAVLGFELIIRIIEPSTFDYIKNNPDLHRALGIHLGFSVPALLLMPAMLYTGLSRRRSGHLFLAVLFSIAWAGTFITGIFFLPHTSP